MSCQYMFDNSKTKTGPAFFPGAIFVHAIKTLCDTGYMLWRDTFTIIRYLQMRTFLIGIPVDPYDSTLRSMLHSIINQIGKGAIKLSLIAPYPKFRIRIQVKICSIMPLSVCAS
jgi:hypothetical protein